MSRVAEGLRTTHDWVVEARALTKAYQRNAVLKGVDLRVERASFVVLLGPSGSGKTTLLRCIAGTEKLTAGDLRIDGREVASASLHVSPERRNLSMVFQDYALWPHMTAAANVGFALRRLSLGKSERRRRGLEMLERVGLAHLADQYPTRLSGGQQQRVALARALVAGMPLLLCDEPLSNLDTHLREQIRVEIATLSRDSGATVIYITHDQQEAFALADQLAVINEGRICQMAPPEDVYWHPADPFVAQFTGLSGHLTGTVVGLAGDRLCRVRIGLTEVVATTVQPPTPRTQVSLLLRPDSLSICSSERTDGILYGMVRDTAFRAGAYDHVVETAGGARLVGVRSTSRASRGANVVIAVDPAGCLAFPLGFDPAQDPLSSRTVGASQRPLQYPVAAGPALEQAADPS
ncbi:MAG: ABC transporter ATP-binding protein [Candidatus Dormibacteria bacterium]